MGKGVVEDHFLVEAAKYTRYDQLGKDLVEFCEETLWWRQLRKRSRPQRSYTHGDRNGDRNGQRQPTRQGTASAKQMRRIWQRFTSSTNVRTTWEPCSCGEGLLVRQERLTFVRHRHGQVQRRQSQPECFRCGNTSHMTKDCRSNRHKEGHDLASVAETEESEKEVGGLSTLCGVERTGDNGLRQSCALEEIRRIKIGVDSGAAASKFGQEISAKTVPRRRQSATAKQRQQTSCQPRRTVSPHEIARWHHSRCEDASDTRAETFDECCGHERCPTRCVLPRVRSELRSTQRDRHGHEIHQKQGRLGDRCRCSATSFRASKAPHNGVRPNKREYIAESAAVDTPMQISVPSTDASRSDTEPQVEVEQAVGFESGEPINVRLLRAPWEPTKEEKEVYENKGSCSSPSMVQIVFARCGQRQSSRAS